MTSTLDSSTANASMHSVLVVDDEEIVLVALRDTLQREGYKVVTCRNAIEALALLKQHPFSAIISDQQMPMITGLEFLAQAKQIQPDATRILITAVLSLNTVIDAINKGEIYRFVVKPWLREDLLATVRTAVQRYELVCKNLVLQATTRAMNEKLTKSNKALEEKLAKLNAQKEELERFSHAAERNFNLALELSAKLLHACQPNVAATARCVVDLCRALAAHLKLSREQEQILDVSARLHDIGLINLPRDLVEQWQRSPESLNPADLERIEQHPVLSQEWAVFGDDLEEVGRVIRAHHERWDGQGYPDHLKNEEIPWLARLLAVAVFYANTELDPKRKLALIERASDSAFDPAAVRALQGVLSRD
ncbi:MAG: response regulator [Verrucomicrobiales bacterium]|nr:response regulator [Verrucomicrobiales bacterium]